MALILMIIAVSALWPYGASANSCTSAADCSLNGDCISNACVCDPWWSGSPQCDVLALLPTDKNTGYHNSSVKSSWGGMSIQDDAGKWHLFAAEMENSCGLSSWKTNSRIIRGVSQSNAPNGPFSFAQEIKVPFAHNPKVFRAPDGTYLLFYIGLWETPPAKCSPTGSTAELDNTKPWLAPSSLKDYPGPNHDTCGPDPLNGGCGLALATAPSPTGPWTTTGIVVQNQNASALLDCAHTNPSPWIFPNGTIVMAINAGYCHNSLETIGLLTAPSYRGPWTYLVTDPILHNSDGSVHRCEDPYLWYDHRGYHLMVHNQQGGQIALYAHSLEGRAWTLHNNAGNPGPYSGVVTWTDGTHNVLDVERPQFVFDPTSGKPLFLTNGALDSGDRSFTLFRPLKQA